ncbi:MAG TPA: hypothetical protein VF607_12465 [Verrucomicrobiae bacterium]
MKSGQILLASQLAGGLWLAATCLPAAGKDVTTEWFANGQFLETNPAQQLTNHFGGRLDFTDELNPALTIATNWTSLVSVRKLDSVLIVVFVACDDAQEQDITGELTIRQPNGTICIHHPPAPLFQAKPTKLNLSPAPLPSLHLGTHNTIFMTDPGDAIGKYQVEVILRDRLRHQEVCLTKTLNVTP